MRIKTFEDLISIAEKVANVVGIGKTEVHIIVSEQEYNEYISNPENTVEAYFNRVPVLPVFNNVVEGRRNEPLLSFMHRSGVKVILTKVKTDIYR